MKKYPDHYNTFCSATMRLIIILTCVLTGVTGCERNHLPTISTGGHDYAQVNLVADTTGFGAARIDHNLSNPWGMAVSAKGTIWICCNHSGQCLTYDNNGNQLYSPVTTSSNGYYHNGSSPNGIVFNNTQDFVINGMPAFCLCCTEGGVITAWISGDSTVAVADRSSYKTLYKGITIASDGTGNFIYATDFFNSKIDVFDKSFNPVNKPFTDPGMATGFAPFNICNIDGKLFVTYAKQKGPDFQDAQNGVGNGYIDIFNPDGSFVKRFASQGTLNAPWGITKAPAGFGQIENAILVSNYGDGHITVFDANGAYQGQIESNGTPITIDGLWDISFISGNAAQLYFTSGPANESHGLFGYLKIK